MSVDNVRFRSIADIRSSIVMSALPVQQFQNKDRSRGLQLQQSELGGSI
jgi:hypothetical protein